MKRAALLAAIPAIMLLILAPLHAGGDKPAPSGNADARIVSSAAGAVAGTPADQTATPGIDRGMMYVMATVLLAWGGIGLYLFRLDRKLSRIEKEIHE